MFRSPRSIICLLATLSLLVAPFAVRAERPQTLMVQIYGADNKRQSSFKLPTANDAGGASVAVGDLGTDGIPEIVIGNGLGNEPRVRVLRTNGTEIGSFLAYGKSMGQGVNVAVCDLDGDGTNEIVTTAQRGGGPHVRVFTNVGKPIGTGWFAYPADMKAGINLACGDLDGDGHAELVTLPAAGAAPNVNVWKSPMDATGALTLWRQIVVTDETNTQGLIGYITGGMLQLATQIGPTITMWGVTFGGAVPKISPPNTRAGFGNAIGSVLLLRGNQIFSSATNGQIADENGKELFQTSIPSGSSVAASADFDRDGLEELIVVPSRPLFDSTRSQDRKSIVVDLSEQRLYAYENGILINTFLVSTARAPFKTPIGTHQVTDKVLFVNYKGGIGKDAYDLGIIKWNLRFAPHIYIHYAPWHNNFGYTMSHGCVNVRLDRMMWTYLWAEKNIPVIVRD